MNKQVTELMIIGAMIAGTMITRFLPFILFPAGKETPLFVDFLGKTLPFASIGLLVVYCLKDINFMVGNRGIPELLAVLLTVILHRKAGNSLLSIGAGTIFYMILVQTIFS